MLINKTVTTNGDAVTVTTDGGSVGMMTMVFDSVFQNCVYCQQDHDTGSDVTICKMHTL